ncbi:MAG: hypothetical protein PHQ19_07505 [Candidatus Krumholzibacteria bacterium]|nr:hypothetical protein [Candidatus Krumholzibacteria bacterium]
MNGWRALALIAAAALPAARCAPAASVEVDFLIPGVSLESVDFRPGTSVTYLIVSEAHGVRDSSLVTLAVESADSLGVGLRVVSSPHPFDQSESVAVHLTLCPGVRGVLTPDEFYACIGDILVRDGTGPMREPSIEEIEGFDIDRLFLRRREGLQREQRSPETVVVPAGEFSCEVWEYFRSERRPVEMGGIEALRIEEERSILRICPDVPFWGLVSSRVERSSSTAHDGGDRAWSMRPRVTVTESILLEFRTPAD